ncbi:MAG: ribonuclease III [Acidimicrobiia bacterium]|nr:ribonuclease III [Acidimicrobiia bacterium]
MRPARRRLLTDVASSLPVLSEPASDPTALSEPASDPTALSDSAVRSEPAVCGLADRLGYRFTDPDLLERALAHRSWCAETPGNASNERLEFLGDAILGLVVTDHIYRTYPDLPEGELAKVRASVVSAAALAEVAGELDLGAALLLGKGEDASGGREKPSILADALEAVIGVTYLDGGWTAAAGVVLRLLEARIAEAAAGPGGQDYKTRLQELSARAFEDVPSYEVVDDGPDHAKRFFASVTVGGLRRGRGEGRSKKQAEQAAARSAWEQLRGDHA